MANMYHWHPAYADYPIVNIKHSSAKKYCEWLTQQYNQQSKRKYSKVTFRLPTKKEWEHAARAGDKNVKTPFPNDNFEGGETEFLYQNRREKAVAGDVLIFPCQYTHVHRGNPPIDGDKYLVTSWAWIQNNKV